MMQASTIQLEPSWLAHLKDEFAQPYMQKLTAFLLAQKQQGKVIYPSGSRWFSAFEHTPIDKVKAVILGQDPYHGPGQAHGLSFSVPPGVKQPPSLVNIFKEIEADLGVPPPPHGNLEYWANNGVLLLNSVLTVERAVAASHQGKGWETLTDKVIRILDAKRDGLVFMLWGSYAQRKGAFIDQRRHLVLKAPHPSPLSAYRGFFGCSHFSKANSYLRNRGGTEIDWSLPPE